MQRITRTTGGCLDAANAWLEYAETDPTGRYGRFREVLGKGAMKTVYRAFDEVLGMEVAWSQVKLHDVFRSPDELQRLYSEVHLLKNLDHESIIKFYTSWVDPDRRTFNFITELFTSGTLREYRRKFQGVRMVAIKNWARQILKGLAYLHSHDPPVIHRDLKCDNLFVNGHLGQVKIGDLGLAAILRGSQHAHSVIGTPEFMAPELYEEEYDELVDIYSFGMCLLEMLTSEYPYSECSNPAQIYKKVTSGKLPEAFHRIQDDEAREFVGKCLKKASERLPAQELLLDPFLASDDGGQLLLTPKASSGSSTPKSKAEATDLMVPPIIVPDLSRNTDMTITGSMNSEDDTIYLKVQITEKDGHARNIYFPFDIMNDTALDVALEMVRELEISDREPMEIAEMIEEEISSLVPTWKKSGLPLKNHHNSFSFEDDDDDEETCPPFHTYSSCSSSHASLPNFDSPFSDANLKDICNNMMNGSPNWLQDHDAFAHDEATSPSSASSPKYSNYSYCSSNEDEYDTSTRGDPHCFAKTHQSTRFCPEEHKRVNDTCRRNKAQFDSQRDQHLTNRKQKMTRIQSLVDIRSQLLHRSLVEEINKRRLFKTVGAVENIGYQEPHDFPGQRFEW
ncbi:hypothetical protein BT93_A0703 [Corymbia citriodora subsp. variegata]|nr:hypothetical protein BT93_A0703 [Corymbia citriodora subsp. variegata]